MPSGRALIEFLTAAVLIIVLPGPSVLFTIGRAIAYGKSAAVLTVLGNSLGALVLAGLAAAGVGPLVQRSQSLLIAVQLVGAGYLVYLGVQAWRSRHTHAAPAMTPSARTRGATLVREGFSVGVLNPKTAVFFATVMPRFIEPGSPSVPWSLFLMGAMFVAIAFVSDSGYGLLAGQLRSSFESNPAAVGRLAAVGGCMIMALGLALLAGTVVEALR